MRALTVNRKFYRYLSLLAANLFVGVFTVHASPKNSIRLEDIWSPAGSTAKCTSIISSRGIKNAAVGAYGRHFYLASKLIKRLEKRKSQKAKKKIRSLRRANRLCKIAIKLEFNITPIATPSTTITSEPSPTASVTPSTALTATKTPVFSPTPTETPTFPPTATNTPSFSPTATKTPTPSPTQTGTQTSIATPTKTPTITPTATGTPTSSGVTVSWGSATLKLDNRGYLERLSSYQTDYDPLFESPFCRIETREGDLIPSSSVNGSLPQLKFIFNGVNHSSELSFEVLTNNSFSLWRLTNLEFSGSPIKSIRCGQLPLKGISFKSGMGFGYDDEDFAVAIMGTDISVRSTPPEALDASNDSGVTHAIRPESLVTTTNGAYSARFTATSSRGDSAGKAYSGVTFNSPMDLTGVASLRALVSGDGKGEIIKLRLKDVNGSYRDYERKIDFTDPGWQDFMFKGSGPDGKIFDEGQVTKLGVWYTSLPSNTSVSTSLDDITAVISGGGLLLLEDFESITHPIWETGSIFVETYEKFGHDELEFGIIASPRHEFETAIADFEEATGLPSPYLNGVWAKKSPRVKRSYLMVTDTKSSDLEIVAQRALEGNFDTVLIGESWTTSHGSYDVSTNHFPDGLDGGSKSLKSAVEYLKGRGLHVGLHFLAPAIDVNDPLVNPPNADLVRGQEANLTSDIGRTNSFIPSSPEVGLFPAEDGGYNGQGTYILIDDEIIYYESIESSGQNPGFNNVIRGALGTAPEAHSEGALISHLPRPFGHFLFDIDSPLADAVIGKVCNVARTAGVDMIYMDGSERLQGDHWYYNAKLHKKYFECLADRNILFQASSYSQFSWHILGRAASADGIADIKGYLDERATGFPNWANNLMPLDVGWYFFYRQEITPDQFEYVLQKSIGWDSSISVQTNPNQLRNHSELPAIFGLINKYETQRLEKSVPEESISKLRQKGREYRLLEEPLRLRRVLYPAWPWEEVKEGDNNQKLLTVKAPSDADGCRLGTQIRVLPDGPGSNYTTGVMLDSFETVNYSMSYPGSLRDKIIAAFEKVDAPCKFGSCARFSVKNISSDPAAWVAASKVISRNLSGKRGLGFWFDGDGKGGSIKIRLYNAPDPITQAVRSADFVISNNFDGWRYTQKSFEEAVITGDFEWSNEITKIAIFFNNIPVNKELAVFLDDIKILSDLDIAEIVDPKLEVDGELPISFDGAISSGERLVYFPGEVPEIIPSKPGPSRYLSSPSGSVEFGIGSVKNVLFSFENLYPGTALTKVQWILDCPAEEIPLGP